MPDWKIEVRKRMATLRLAPTREQTIVEEIAQDLEDCYAEWLARGVTPAAAYQHALAELSDHELLARELRRVEATYNPDPPVLGTNQRRRYDELVERR